MGGCGLRVPVVCDTTHLQLGFHNDAGGCCLSILFGIGNNVRRIVMGDRDSTRRAGYVDTLLVFLFINNASHMAATAVRFPTPQRVDGSTQHTSVEVTDPLLCPPELAW